MVHGHPLFDVPENIRFLSPQNVDGGTDRPLRKDQPGT
jgi:hypothetical protein